MKGKIKWFNLNKGFGFVQGEDDEDYFLHISQVPNGEQLKEEQPVEFEVVQTDKGNQAHNLQLIEE